MGSGGDDSGLVRDTRLPSAGPRVDQGMKIHHVFMTWKVTLDVSVIFDSGITEEVPVTRGCRVSTVSAKVRVDAFVSSAKSVFQRRVGRKRDHFRHCRSTVSYYFRRAYIHIAG